MGQIAMMSNRGDVRAQWDPNVPEEVENAKAMFDKMRKKGYQAFEVDEKNKGKKGRLIREFDPKAGMIIMAKPMVGG